MKKVKITIIIAIILGIIVSIYAANQTKKENKIEEVKDYIYHILYKDEKMGIIDKSGKIIIEPIHEYIQLPNPSKAIFICTNGDNTKVYNEKNEEIFKEYNQVSAIPLQNQKDEVQYEKSVLKFQKDNKYGLINMNEDEISKASYEEIVGLKYKEGELLVKSNGLYGVINTKGVKIIDVEYDMIEADRYYKDGEYNRSRIYN